jgi:NAD(P)-dependent dehydrogenase (short-subunit alcohol dehydrogenase family)
LPSARRLLLDHLYSVFANAAIAKYALLGTITEEFYDSIFNINVKGVLFTVQKALPLLPDGASIILTASIAASKGMPSDSILSATKAAIRSFARTWTADLRDRRIRVNAVSPGPTETPGFHKLLGSSSAGAGKLISTPIPLRPARNSRWDRQSRCIPRIGGQQLHHRNRAVRRWRIRTWYPSSGHGRVALLASPGRNPK